MSFARTTDQFVAGTKTVTRRTGWQHLKPGTYLKAVRKAMGLRKGEKQEVLGYLKVLNVRRERLDKINQDEVWREGFPDMTPQQFVEMFCAFNRCAPEDYITRIEFIKVDQVPAQTR